MDQIPIEEKRRRYDILFAEMTQERDGRGWRGHWMDLADYVQPRRSRFFVTDRNLGNKRSEKIIDSTATVALRTLVSGMMSGITSPSRPWFKLTSTDAKLQAQSDVQQWLADVTDITRQLLSQSNVYDVLPLVYEDLGCFGTSAMAILEDDSDVFRAYSFPVGSYFLACSSRGAVDTMLRKYSMTVRQVVEEFGIDAVTDRVKSMFENNSREKWVDVCHVITGNAEYDAAALAPKYKRFTSCYYEDGADKTKFLRESGFDEFPLMAPRWKVTGEDIYGISPGMELLADVRGLQTLHLERAKAIAKQVNPPLKASAVMMGKQISMLPGAITFYEGANHDVISTLHDVALDLSHLEASIREHQERINIGFFAKLWLLIAQDERAQPATAEEIRAKEQEKLLQLGPVYNRITTELLRPMIDRVVGIGFRAKLYPPPPQSLRGQPLKIEFSSIMQQAQKMIGLASTDRLVGFAANMAKVDPTVMDKIDLDAAIDDYAEGLGSNPEIVRSDDQVAAIRAQRAKAQQAQNQQQAILNASQSAKNLAGADTSGDNGLTRLLALNGSPVPAGAP